MNSSAEHIVFHLTYNQHIAIGLYLVLSGIVVAGFSLIGLATFATFRSLWTPSAIPEVSFLLAELSIAGLHPFSGASALYNRWLWGDGGCYIYSLAAFLFGTYQLTAVTFVALDRYFEDNDDLSRYRNFKTYSKIFAGLFVHAIFWSVMPLTGWAQYESYDLTPPQITCILSLTQTDISYISYLLVYTVSDLIVPFAIASYCYYKISKRSFVQRWHWADKRCPKMIMLGCLLTTYLLYSVYGFVCYYHLFTDPSNLPVELFILPELAAKMAGLVNPIFYLLGNPRLRACAKKLLRFNFDDSESTIHHDDPEGLGLTSL